MLRTNQNHEIQTDNTEGNSFKPNKRRDGHKDLSTEKVKGPYSWKFCWPLVVALTFEHVAGLYGAYLCFSDALWMTRLFAFLVLVIAGLGINAGAHRLWSHRTYKARWPLQVILASFFLLSFQLSLLRWARDHRVHHKFSETDADPHNAQRGFFFAHMGWLLLKKHPDVIAKGRSFDLSDLLNDKLVMFIEKYQNTLYLISILIPTYVPTLWGENIWTAFFLNWFRILWLFHTTGSINSFAHMWGSKPYDKNIGAVENKIGAFFSIGEGFHNYHHTFPTDYKAAELGPFSSNLTTDFIDAMATIGWAYDLKTVDKNIVKQRVQRTGDGSNPASGIPIQELKDM